MFRIIKTDGTELGITDSVLYIKIGANGCFTPTTKKNAIGVAFKSVAYNLAGHSEIKNADTVEIFSVDIGERIHDVSDALNILLGVNE